jgi:hypothetical protein
MHGSVERGRASMKRPLVLLAAVGGALLALVRRRKGQADAALWREATSDSSR